MKVTVHRGTRFRILEPLYDPALRTLEDDVAAELVVSGAGAESSVYALADGTIVSVDAGDDADDPPFFLAAKIPSERRGDVAELGNRRFLRDYAQTRAAFAKLPGSGYAGPDCGPCAPCRNFQLVRARAYPPALMAFLERLGVDPTKESEVIGCREPDGWFYTNWFDAAGVAVLDRPHDFEPLIEGVRVEGVEVCVIPSCGPQPWSEPRCADIAFGPGPMLDIQVRAFGLPWLLDEEEPT